LDRLSTGGLCSRCQIGTKGPLQPVVGERRAGRDGDADGAGRCLFDIEMQRIGKPDVETIGTDPAAECGHDGGGIGGATGSTRRFGRLLPQRHRIIGSAIDIPAGLPSLAYGPSVFRIGNAPAPRVCVVVCIHP
jgi:hypothetical protein